MSERDTVRQRMATQRLTGAGRASPGEVVRALGAVQAQEFAEAKWSLSERMDGEPTDLEIEEAFARGEIIRTHVLRPTWHFVAPEDLRWMLELTAPRVHQANRSRYAQLGLDEPLLRRGSEVIVEALRDGEPKLRKELQAALAHAGIDVAGSAMGYMVMYAELEALICSGPRRGKHQTYALVDQRVERAQRMSREAAVAELARRYFTSHGPATLKDFVWWSGLTMKDARAGVEALPAELVCELSDDGIGWYGPPDPPLVPRDAGAHLIPMYDELGMAYKDLRMVYASPPPQGVMARPILIEGLCFGSWRRTFERGEVVVEATLIAKLTRAQSAALEEVVERFGRFHDMPARTRRARP